MVIKGGYIDSMVDHKMEHVPGEGVTVTNCSGNSLIIFVPYTWSYPFTLTGLLKSAKTKAPFPNTDVLA